jgi:hypothetical protein
MSKTKQKHKNHSSSHSMKGFPLKKQGNTWPDTKSFISTYVSTYHMVADGTHQNSTRLLYGTNADEIGVKCL